MPSVHSIFSIIFIIIIIKVLYGTALHSLVRCQYLARQVAGGGPWEKWAEYILIIMLFHCVYFFYLTLMSIDNVMTLVAHLYCR